MQVIIDGEHKAFIEVDGELVKIGKAVPYKVEYAPNPEGFVEYVIKFRIEIEDA